MMYTEAITRRISNRKYIDRPLTREEISELQKIIDQCNEAGGLRLQLITGCPGVFARMSGRSVISGARNLIAMIGSADDPNVDEKCGYYGEKVVLTATSMGLGTCWVSSTYDRDACQKFINAGEKLCCVAAIGPTTDQPSTKEKLIYGVLQHKSKSTDELSKVLRDAPAWFMSAIASVQRAPSAKNLQPVRFYYDHDTVTARLTETHSSSSLDLGIAKYHFEVGAHGGVWTWGDGGSFTKAKEEKSCGAVIYRSTPNGREYLLAQHGASHWSFPKGHVEAGENERQTALREIREETGLTVSLDTGFRQMIIYYPKPGVIKDVVFFVAFLTGGTEHAQEGEIRQLGWFPFSQAQSLVTFASDVEVLKAAEAYLNQK